jgi:hypothetical protein
MTDWFSKMIGWTAPEEEVPEPLEFEFPDEQQEAATEEAGGRKVGDEEEPVALQSEEELARAEAEAKLVAARVATRAVNVQKW